MAHKYVFKYIIIGDTGVGKSCLLLQFTDNRFNPDYNVTIGAEFGGKMVILDEVPLYLQIWDTAGQENYLSIARSYYRGAAIALIVYDITRRSTFENVERWVSEVRENANSQAIIILIGNKSDMEDNRAVSVSEGRELAKRNNLLFAETSAKEATHVCDAFEFPAKLLCSKISKGDIRMEDFGHGIKMGELPQVQTKKCCRG